MQSCRSLAWIVAGLALALAGCKRHGPGDDGVTVDAPYVADACLGLGCFVVDCASKGLPPTSVSGKVFAPNGTLPLYGVNVYVPVTAPGPLVSGAQCDRCANGLQGGAYTQTATDEAGNFTLKDVPATSDVPIVIQVGKWRRQIKVPTVAACQDVVLGATETTLPKKQSEGDLPKIAITTGNADALECLVRKLGIDDSEFTTDAGTGSVHMFNGNGASAFRAGFAGGAGAFPLAPTLWSTVDKLDDYDITLLSCEGAQRPATKPQSSMQALHDYAGKGGRVFMSHWHNIWIGGENGNLTHGLADWQSIVNFNYAAAQNETTQLTIVDEVSNPKGMSYATWLQNVGASTVRDEIPVSEPRYTAASIKDPPQAERWVYVDPARSTPLGKVGVQDLLFTTPIDVAKDQRCGKVVFSDMHVASGSTSPAAPDLKTNFPNGCSTMPLTPQEKALAFIFFDISSCVGVIQ